MKPAETIDIALDEKKIRQKVKGILDANFIEGYSKMFKSEYCFIKPSKSFYRFQFFWDSCFHVFILTCLGGEEIVKAKRCFRSLFAMQRDTGFVGHIHYWNNVLPSRWTDIFQSRPDNGINLFREHTSALIQPPLVAQALMRIYKVSDDMDYLKEMLPKVKMYFDWLAKYRDYDNDGLITIITPFESGMDWKASYDPLVNFPRKKANRHLFVKMVTVDFKNFLRNYNDEKIRKHDHFRVKDAGFNTIYIKNLRTLAELCKEVNDPDAAKYELLADKALKSMIDLMYDDEDAAFYDVCTADNIKLRILTPTVFFPVVLKGIPDEIDKKVLDRHMFNKEEFHTEYPIPSLAINDPAFDPNQSMYLWRGPTWIVNNWFMHRFLLDKGYEEEASILVRAIVRLIEKSGFREYYNPFTGEGHGAKEFTWAGLVVDMINMEKGKTTVKGEG